MRYCSIRGITHKTCDVERLGLPDRELAGKTNWWLVGKSRKVLGWAVRTGKRPLFRCVSVIERSETPSLLLNNECIPTSP
jgi:hypothetical protein